VKLVVGLGNPGPRYRATRHNAGFRIVERWCRRSRLALDEERFGGRYGAGLAALPGGRRVEVAVLEPQGFMNVSGAAVAAAWRGLALADPAEELLVVLDDVDLPFGKLRLRAAGGAGGHRGLADVIERLGTGGFPRLRFGVGRPAGEGDTAEWVLEPFSPQEDERLAERLERACDALDVALVDGIEAAMNRFNREPGADAC
jgi:PTH1 family peptidyl-tRNA hydrolase